MDRNHALSVYEKYKRTCNAYMQNQRRTCQASKGSSSSTKSACSFERSHDHNRARNLKNSRNRLTYSELKEEKSLKREKKHITPISFKTKHGSTSAIVEEISRVWDIYRHLLQQKQEKARVVLANEKCEFKVENVLEVKFEEIIKEKVSEHLKELSEEKSMSASPIVEEKGENNHLLQNLRM